MRPSGMFQSRFPSRYVDMFTNLVFPRIRGLCQEIYILESTSTLWDHFNSFDDPNAWWSYLQVEILVDIAIKHYVLWPDHMRNIKPQKPRSTTHRPLRRVDILFMWKKVEPDPQRKIYKWPEIQKRNWNISTTKYCTGFTSSSPYKIRKWG